MMAAVFLFQRLIAAGDKNTAATTLLCEAEHSHN